VSGGALLERDGELEAAAAVLAGAAGGAGAVLAVEGAAGLGKTVVLDAVAERARAEGFTVLRARGVELEAVLAYGIVRRLLGRIGGLDAALPDAGPEAGDPFVALHALYVLCTELAEEAPLLLVVDDAQWADGASLRFLAYAHERLDGVRMAVAIGLRPAAPGDHAALTSLLAADPRTARLTPRPLSAEGAAAVVRARLPEAGDALCRACHRATGGNPFYLNSLASDLGTADTTPEAVAGLAPQAVTQAVIARLHALGPDAVAVAKATAILGGDAEVRLAGAFTDLAPERVTVTVDALARAGILRDGRPLAFVHPIVHSAVLADLPAGEHALARRRAAQILNDEEAHPLRVALQLLPTDPDGAPSVVEALVRGAAAAQGPGGSETAVALLRRALDEPPPADRRRAVLTALGTAERHAMAPEAAGHLEAALALTREEADRVALTVELAAAREQQGRSADAIELIEHALARQDEGEGGEGTAAQAALLEAQIAVGRFVALMPRPAAERARTRLRLERLDPSVLEARLLAGVLAFDEVAYGGTAAEARRLVRMALGTPLEPAAFATVLPMVALVAAVGAGLPELALSAVDVGAAAQATGSRWTAATSATWRALAAHATGDLAGAEADASGGVEGFADLPVGRVAAVGILAGIVLDRRGAAAAGAEVLDGTAVAAPPVTQALFLHEARSRVALGRRDHGAALAEARELERLLARGDRDGCALFPWRLDLARALLAAGERAAAAATARDRRAEAEAFGEPGAIADALVICALTSDGDALATLQDAADAAAACARPLVQARALGALGAALRRAGRPADARRPLTEALERAEGCGARPAAEHLREELAAAGVRARLPADVARWELTPSELRVCRLAAGGMTNREIAQNLFVTTKTVETHLGAAFRKLDITSRRDLARALEDHAAPAAAG
jgi:DNA-binding CsgD family transcriptional regulator